MLFFMDMLATGRVLNGSASCSYYMVSAGSFDCLELYNMQWYIYSGVVIDWFLS